MDGAIKIYPAREMKAVDMAELMRVALTFDGIIQGCRLAIDSDQRLTMTPGRIVIEGRLAYFGPDEGSSVAIIDTTQVSQGTLRVVCAVCDLDASLNNDVPFYISVLTPTEVTALDNRISAAGAPSDVDYNVANGVRYLRLATVTIGNGGVVSALVTNSANYTIKSNKKYIDDTNSELNTTIADNQAYAVEWKNYLNSAKFNRNFFTTYRAVGDGLTIAANTSKEFYFRREKDSQVIIESGSGSESIPSNVAYVVMKADGTIVSEGAPSFTPIIPPNGPHGAPTGLVEDVWIHFGIIEVNIENASNSGSGAANCVLQSYRTSTTNSGGRVHAKIRNVGNTAAKIKLTIRSLYVRDIDG